MKFIIDKIGLLIILLTLSGFSQTTKENSSKTIILILGSGDLNTSLYRAEVGFNLYKSRTDFDYIIVSGGCGAHNSSICEARVMADMLIEKGVPKNIIFREEKSKSTSQNFCYSRELKNLDGTQLINTGDHLFVVSNHWHAMSVSGCFNDKDLVNSNYVIEGHITPKQDDKTDYGAIYENCINNPNYCKSVLWPKIDAAYNFGESGKKHTQNHVNFFIKDLMIKSLDSTNFYSSISEELSELPEVWKSNIDASFYNKFENLIYLFKNEDVVAVKPGSSKMELGHAKSMKELFENLSDYWGIGPIDAAFFNSNTKQIYFFKGDHFVRIKYKKNKKLIFENPKSISELVPKWPFDWGSGHIDAALFVERTDEVLLYRGQEKLKLKFDGDNLTILEEIPQKLNLEWPTALWGDRNLRRSWQFYIK